MTTHRPERTIERIQDDRMEITAGDATLLIIEDDPHYAAVLRDAARTHDFKVLVAHRGDEALRLAREYRPSAISLDIFLPDMLGWTVLSHLKHDPNTRHIPVQIVTLDEDRQHGLSRGAFSFITKSTTTQEIDATLARIKAFTESTERRLLVVEDNLGEQLSIKELLGHDDIDIDIVSTGAEALEHLADLDYDCVVLDLRLPDMSGFDLLDRIAAEEEWRDLPVVVFTV